MNRLKLLSGIILILILGALCGSIGTWMFVKHRIGGILKGPEPPPIRMLHRWADELDLTEDQQAEFRKIIDESRHRFETLMWKYHPEFQEALDETTAGIKKLLNPDQQDHFNRLYDRMKQRKGRWMKKFMKRPGPSPERFLRELNKRLHLSPDQLEQIRPIIREGIKKRRQLLRRYGDDSYPIPPEIRDELKAHRLSMEKRLSSILTQDQMIAFQRLVIEKLENLLEEHREFPPPGPPKHD